MISKIISDLLFGFLMGGAFIICFIITPGCLIKSIREKEGSLIIFFSILQIIFILIWSIPILKHFGL